MLCCRQVLRNVFNIHVGVVCSKRKGEGKREERKMPRRTVKRYCALAPSFSEIKPIVLCCCSGCRRPNIVC